MNRDIFEAADRCYTWEHVLTAADFRGVTAQKRRDLANALAIRAYADEQGFEAAEADVESAIDEFRLQHELISAEDMENWLDHCGLTLDGIEEFFARRSLVDRFHEHVADISRDYAPTEVDVADRMWAEAILSGTYEELTVPLARRVAVRLDGGTPCTPAAVKEAMREAEARLGGGPLDPEWFAELVEMETIYAAAERDAVTSEKCEREIRVRSLQLTRIEIAEVTFPSRDQAREAYLGVTGEGERLDAVATRSGRAFDLATRFYDEVPDDVRSLFFSAPPNKVFLRDDREGLFAVCEIRRRIEPECGDADVFARVRERLLSTQFDAMLSQHVRWLFDPWNRT
jgi:hypothetical protein